MCHCQDLTAAPEWYFYPVASGIFDLPHCLPWLVALLDPYSAFGRIAADIGQPLAILINNAADWLLQGGHSFALSPQRLFSHGAIGLAAALGTLLLLGYLTLSHGRIWCTHKIGRAHV